MLFFILPVNQQLIFMLWLLRASFIVDSAKCHCWGVYLFCPSLSTLLGKCNLSRWLTPIDLLCANLKTLKKKIIKNIWIQKTEQFWTQFFVVLRVATAPFKLCFLMNIFIIFYLCKIFLDGLLCLKCIIRQLFVMEVNFFLDSLMCIWVRFYNLVVLCFLIY